MDEPVDAGNGNGNGAGESGDSGYDEEQWQRSLDESEFLPSDDNFAGEPEPAPEEAPADGAVPELDELLRQVPQSSQDLVDSLFRGRFIGVRAINRKKLF